MSFETGMVTKLQEISGLKVYPNYAQEGTATPYVIYIKEDTEYERSISGVNSVLDEVTYELNLIHDTKALCESFADQIETKMLSMFQFEIGSEYIQDVEIENRYSQYEPEIEKHREIMRIKIYY